MRETIADMIGKTPVVIRQDEDRIDFVFSDGSSCAFFHEQDCCECVLIEDVNGSWEDLLNQPLLVAEERTSFREDCSSILGGGSETWTFYTFRTVDGSVDVRWYGSSNGYYSESVDFSWKEPSLPVRLTQEN